MQTLAVTFYDVVVWLHVSSVVVAFGPTFAFGIYLALAARKYPRAMPAVLEATITINRSMVTIGGVADPAHRHLPRRRTAGSSASSSSAGGSSRSSSCSGLVHGFFIPHDSGRCERPSATSRPPGRPARSQFSEEFQRETGRSARMGPIAGLIVIVTIYVMVAKPFL